MAFLAVAAAFAALNLAAAFPHGAPIAHSPCPAPLPVIEPVLVQSVAPAPVVIGPQAPGFIDHASAPYEINYFEKPWIIKHKQGAALNVFTQTPVVVDEYAAPSFNEAAAPPAVIVEEVYPQVAAPIAVPAPVFAAPCAPAPPCY